MVILFKKKKIGLKLSIQIVKFLFLYIYSYDMTKITFNLTELDQKFNDI